MELIPKELHLYWDESGMSKLQMFTVTTFHKHNPDWKINVYVSKQDYKGKAKYIPNYKGIDYFPALKQLDYVNVTTINLDDYGISHALHGILRSDIFRYHILYTIGGVWSDFDVLWLKPMEHFRNIEYHGDTPIEEVTDVVSFIHGTGGGHSIGIMIHAKNTAYMKSVLETVKNVKPPYKHETFGSIMLSAHYPTIDSLAKYGNVIGARFETYYPYNIHPPNVTIQKLYNGVDLSCINNNVMCVHWYNGRRESKQYVNKNGYAKNCSMTTLLKQEGCI
jgi:hypothetical protein